MSTDKKVRMKLVGLGCNSYSLNGASDGVLGAWRSTASQQGWTSGEIQAVVDEATSKGDFYDLLTTLKKYTDER